MVWCMVLDCDASFWCDVMSAVIVDRLIGCVTDACTNAASACMFKFDNVHPVPVYPINNAGMAPCSSHAWCFGLSVLFHVQIMAQDSVTSSCQRMELQSEQ